MISIIFFFFFLNQRSAGTRPGGTNATPRVPAKSPPNDSLARSLLAFPVAVAIYRRDCERVEPPVRVSLRKERQHRSTAMPSVTGHRIWFHGRCPLSYSCVEIVKISRGYPPLNWIAATCSLSFPLSLPPVKTVLLCLRFGRLLRFSFRPRRFLPFSLLWNFFLFFFFVVFFLHVGGTRLYTRVRTSDGIRWFVT